MNVVLINPPNHQHDVDDLAPPLGLLMLAQSLIGTGTSVKLIDLNLDSSRGRMPPASDFYPLVCERILALDPDIVCFTSMGINSHVSLKLGRQVKLGNPSVVTVFGGPHFGSIATELKREFPWVDYVNVGVGENSIRQFITSLQRGGRPSSFILG